MDEFIKIVVVGDGAVGKTCLLVSFAQNVFPEEYVPTVFDNLRSNMMYESETVSIGLFDTAGQEDYDRLRPLSYPHTNCFMICFSINKPNSFDNVKVKWKPELHKHAADVPIVLVGTQCDLKNSNSTSEEAGKQLAIDIGATEYIECSAKTRKNLQDVFKACVRAYYAKLSAEKEAKQRKKSICTVL